MWFGLSIFACQAGISQTTIVFQPGPDKGYDAKIWDLETGFTFADDPELIALAWPFSFQGVDGRFRSLLRFDLAGIPASATVLEARLSLYHNPGFSNPGHAGANAALLLRLLGDWDEESVNWDNQPAVDSLSAIRLAKSATEDENYLDIDVLEHVQQMVASPALNFGWLFRLEEEVASASMKFCSSDYPVEALRPRLEITYTESTGTDPVLSVPVRVDPNPFRESLAIHDLEGAYDVTLSDAAGRKVFDRKAMLFSPGGTIIWPEAGIPGIYYLVLRRDGERRQATVVRL